MLCVEIWEWLQILLLLNKIQINKSVESVPCFYMHKQPPTLKQYALVHTYRFFSFAPAMKDLVCYWRIFGFADCLDEKFTLHTSFWNPHMSCSPPENLTGQGLSQPNWTLKLACFGRKAGLDDLQQPFPIHFFPVTLQL